MGAPKKAPRGPGRGPGKLCKEPLGGPGTSPKGSPGRSRKVIKQNGKGRWNQIMGPQSRPWEAQKRGPGNGSKGGRGSLEKIPNGDSRGAQELAQIDKRKGIPNQIMGLQRR
jgi:hypothetical protein